jgi:beta-phosphoglucomutase
LAQNDAWPAIAAVIFDLDGVLTDTAEYHFQAWKRLADEEGIPFSRADNEALRGVSRRKSLEILLKGRPVTEEQAQELMARKNRYYQELIRHMTPDDLLPGVAELLGELRAMGLKVAVATVSKNARAVLDGLQLWEAIDSLSDGYSVGRSKPAPDLFLHAAQQIGVPPSQCLVVEDAAAGIEAAQAAGMHTLALGPARRFAGVWPEVTLPSLEGVSWSQLQQALAARLAADQPWTVRESRFDPDNLGWRETVYTIGNGYLGTRGTFEERYPGDQPATLINGLFDAVPIIHTELVAVPDWLNLELLVDGERFGLDQGRVLAYERVLDMRDGTLSRRVRWQSPRGHTLEVYVRRWASLADERLCALRCGVTALDFDGDVELRAAIDGAVENPGNLLPSEVGLRHWSLLSHGVEPQGAWLHARTRVSGAELGAAMHLKVEGVPEVSYDERDYVQAPGVAAHMRIQRGQTAVATKLVAYATSPAPREALVELERAVAEGYESLLSAHRAAWRDLWRSCDIEIEGDVAAQRAVRYNLYQLLIAVPHHNPHVSIPAKTLSGFGYRGHVFWDTDIFIVPFFAYTRPELARNLLLYRYHTLPGARENARRTGYEGARYAWESAEDGRETTPPWVPLPDGSLARCWCGEIELHINADVAYAVWRYWQVTGDDDFLRDYGAEILLDTAVFWGSRVEYNAAAERYELTGVIGPDEYHEHVNNNAFTNRMVQWHFERALEVLDWLRRHHPAKAEELVQRLNLSAERLALWNDIRQRIYIPYDPDTGLFEQFDGFFALEDLDWSALEPRTRPVQMVLGIEETQRYQALKQPDVLMLLYLLSDEYEERILRVNWQYYEPRTDHNYGSSLGPAIHALLAARQGLLDDAYEHFLRAALVDLEDLRGNTRDGIHAASAGGVWQVVVMGFAGLRAGPEGLSFAPRLPERWQRLRFNVQYRGRAQEVELRAGEPAAEARRS